MPKPHCEKLEVLFLLLLMNKNRLFCSLPMKRISPESVTKNVSLFDKSVTKNVSLSKDLYTRIYTKKA